MKRAVTLVAVVLGCLLGIAQAGAWSCWMCDVLVAYWARCRCSRSWRQPTRFGA